MKFVFLLFVVLSILSSSIVECNPAEEEAIAAEVTLEDAILESVKLDLVVSTEDDLFITIVTDDGQKLCDGRISGAASLDQINCAFDPEIYERPEIVMTTTVYSVTNKEVISQSQSRLNNPSFRAITKVSVPEQFVRKVIDRVVDASKDKRLVSTGLIVTGLYGLLSLWQKVKGHERTEVSLFGSNSPSKPPFPPSFPFRKGSQFYRDTIKAIRMQHKYMKLQDAATRLKNVAISTPQSIAKESGHIVKACGSILSSFEGLISRTIVSTYMTGENALRGVCDNIVGLRKFNLHEFLNDSWPYLVGVHALGFFLFTNSPAPDEISDFQKSVKRKHGYSSRGSFLHRLKGRKY